MKTIQIEVTIDPRINVGNFEGFSTSVTLKADLEEGDNFEECVRSLQKDATKSWAADSLKKIRMYQSMRKDKSAFDKTMTPTMTELKKILAG